MATTQHEAGGIHPIRWTKEAAGTTWYAIRKTGNFIAKLGIVAGVSVPVSAGVAEIANAIGRAKTGHDVLPGFMASAGDWTASRLDGSVPEQVVGIVAKADLAGITAVHALTEGVSEISDVASAWLPAGAEAPVDTVVDTVADLGAAAAAGYGAWKLGRTWPDSIQR